MQTVETCAHDVWCLQAGHSWKLPYGGVSTFLFALALMNKFTCNISEEGETL